ncbi:MAG: hypothetical protein JWM99_1743 [Verrucomicrobiales bacterium]|nr:hypothetical protein [Verrucomicrobiales bacterium]
MNCGDFNDRLPEYLDDALSATQGAAAREHLQKCSDCQRVLAREETFGKTFRSSLNRETQILSLNPAVRRNILNAAKQPPVPPTAREIIRAYFAILWRRPAAAGIAFLCFVSLIFAHRFYPGSAKHSFAQAIMEDERITYAIDVPIQTPIHVYRRQNNMVIDAVVTGISVIDASFSENMRPSASAQPPIN